MRRQPPASEARRHPCDARPKHPDAPSPEVTGRRGFVGGFGGGRVEGRAHRLSRRGGGAFGELHAHRRSLAFAVARSVRPFHPAWRSEIFSTRSSVEAIDSPSTAVMMSPPRPNSWPFDFCRSGRSLDAGGRCRAAFLDLLHEHAFFDRQVERLRQFGGDRRAADPEVAVFVGASRTRARRSLPWRC